MSEAYKILLAEDDEDINSLISEILSGEGYECTSAKNGLEASEYLKKEKFNLLITDFKMPEMNGVELLNWCRKNKIHLPVIFISANYNLLSTEELAPHGLLCFDFKKAYGSQGHLRCSR